MQSKNKQMIAKVTVLILLGPLALWPGCRRDDRPATDAEDHGDDHGHDHGQKAEAPEADERAHQDHAHEHGAEGSDLDRPIPELFAARCEHDVATHQCDECRYEVGVVKVPRELIEKGLVEVGPIVERDFDSEVQLTGEIKFDNRKIAHLGPRVKGTIRTVQIDVGDRVKAGQVLLALDSNELAEAESAYLEILAEQRLARTAFERQQELRKDGINSQREFLEAKQHLEADTIAVTAAEQKLGRLGHNDKKIQKLSRSGARSAAGRLLVTAPFDGDVLEMHAVRGEQVEAGEEIVLIGDISTLWLWVDLYETQLVSVSTAMSKNPISAFARVAAFPDKQFEGQVDFVGKVMDEHTRTVKARIVLDNPDGLLRPGMFAQVRLGLQAGGRHLSVPSSAVLSDEGRDFVFVHHRDDYYVRRPVTRGREVDGYVEIRGEVEAGQTVAMTGGFLLKSDVLRSKMGAGCAD